MTRTPVGQHLFIEADADRWRLIAPAAVTRSGDLAIVEASPGGPLRYLTAFGVSRRLPGETLAISAVQRVIVGWSRRDTAWHLGLLLTPDAAAPRAGIRWVEIAAWRDLDLMAAAVTAGEDLARVIGLPFAIVPPKDDSSIITPVLPPAAPPPVLVTPAAVPAISLAPDAPAPVVPVLPEPPPRELPLKADAWTLLRLTPDILELRQTGSPGRGAALRALWYLLWAIVLVVLAVTSLTSGIALPQPEWLPYAGFVAAAVLVIAAIRAVVLAGRRVNRIIADGERGEIVGLHNESARWVLPADAIDGLYVTERLSKARRDHTGRTVHDGELNFLMHDGKFWHGAAFTALEEKLTIPAPPDKDAAAALNAEAVAPLDGHGAASTLRQIGWQMARTVQRPAFYDQRVK